MKWLGLWASVFLPMSCACNTFEDDLSASLGQSALTGTEFHRTVLQAMARHRVEIGFINKGGKYLQRSLGDSSVRLLWVNPGGFNIDDLYLIWKREGRARVQKLDRPKGEQWQVFRPAVLRGDELIFCDDAYAGGNWMQPCVRVYRRRGSRWELKQNLYANGKESGGGLSFIKRGGQLSVSRAVGTVRVYPTHLTAPHVGPLLRYDIRFDRVRGTYRQTLFRLVPTPLAALEELSGFRASGKRAAFDRRVPRALRSQLWALLSGKGHRVSTGSNVVDDKSAVLCVNKHDITFERIAGCWKPASIGPSANRG